MTAGAFATSPAPEADLSSWAAGAIGAAGAAACSTLIGAAAPQPTAAIIRPNMMIPRTIFFMLLFLSQNTRCCR
jgi:hypothetical protein